MQSLWMLAAAFLFSLMAACTKWCSDYFSTFELVFYRSLFGMVSLGLWVLWQKKDLRTHLWFSHIKRSCFGTLGLTIWFYTLAVLPLGTSMTLNYTSPLYMALFASVAAIRMGRSLNFGLLAAIVAGFRSGICSADWSLSWFFLSARLLSSQRALPCGGT